MLSLKNTKKIFKGKYVFLLIWLSAIFILLVSGIITYKIVDSNHEKYYESVFEKNAQSVTNHFILREKEIEHLSIQPGFVENSHSWRIEYLEKIFKEYKKKFSNISYADNSGKRWNYLGVEGDIGHRNYFKEAIERNVNIFSDVLVSNTTGNLSMVVGSPFNIKSDKLGLLYGTWDLRDLQVSINQMKVDNEASSILFTEYGTLLSHSDDIDNIGKRFVEEMKNPEIMNRFDSKELEKLWESRSWLSGNNTYSFILIEEERKVFLAKLGVKTVNPVYFALSIDKKNYYRPHMNVIKIYTIIFILISVTFTVGFYYYRRHKLRIDYLSSYVIKQHEMASLHSFLRGIAHQINTPLGTGIMSISYADKMLDKCKKDGCNTKYADIKNNHEMIKTSFDKIKFVMDKLNTLDSMTSSKLGTDENLNKIIGDISDLYKERFSEQGIECIVELGNADMIELNVLSILNVMNILLENIFCHAFPNDKNLPNKKVLIKTEYFPKRKPYQYSLNIIDNGIGIGIANVNQIFEAFYKVKMNTDALGFGLYMVENIVSRKLGGQIQINESNKGTDIEIQFSSIKKKTKG